MKKPKKPTFHDIYRTDQKFHLDPCAIWMFSGPEDDCSVTAADCPGEDDGVILLALCKFLNGDISEFPFKIEKVEHEYIYLDTVPQQILRIRGTGYIKSNREKLGLEYEDTYTIQDEFAQWIADKIKKSQKDV